MARKLSEEIAECHMLAVHCGRRAKHAIDPKIRQDLLAMERRWLTMARSYEFAAELSDFTEAPNRY